MIFTIDKKNFLLYHFYMGKTAKPRGISSDNYRHFKEMANNINYAENRCIFRAKEIYGSEDEIKQFI